MKNIKIWYLILCAFYYFTVTFIGMEIYSYLIFYGIPIVFICLNLKYFKEIINICVQTPLKYFILFFSLLTIGSLLIPVLQQTYDFSYFTEAILSIPKGLVGMIFLVIVFNKYISPERDYRLFIKYYLLACCCYVLFTVVLLAFPSLKMVLYHVIKENEHAKIAALQSDYVTRYGWSGFSNFDHTLKCTWGVCLSLFLILDRVKQKNLDLYIICAILLLGNMFYGRVGLLVSLVILFLFLCTLLKKKSKTFLLFLVVGCVALVALTILGFTNQRVNIWFTWAFAIFINFFKTGKFETVSSNILLQKMIFYPGVKTMLLGDGRYIVDSKYYLNTDAGFMRPMLFGGILFLLIRYFCLIGILWAFVKSKKISNQAARNFLILSMIVIVLAFEIKGEIIMQSICVLFGMAVIIQSHFKYKTINGGVIHE